jgi:tetratricopeptide (TPR) repeat protein
MTVNDAQRAPLATGAYRARLLWSDDGRTHCCYPHSVQRRKAQVLELVGRWDEEEAVLRQNLRHASGLDGQQLIASCEYELAGVLYLKGANGEALALYLRALGRHRSRADAAGIGLVMGGMGSVYRELGDLTKSMECYQEQLRIAQQLRDSTGMARAFGNLGILHCLQEKFGEAMDYFRHKLDLAERQDDQEGIGATVGNMGNVYKMLGDERRALECYDRQLRIARLLGDKRSIGAAVGNSGVIHNDQGDYPKAVACFNTFLEIARELGDKRGIGIAAANLGIAYKRTGDYQDSGKYYDLAIATGRELNAKQYLCGYLSDKADLCIMMQRLDDAGRLINEALALAEDIGEQSDIDKCRELAGRISAALPRNGQGATIP